MKKLVAAAVVVCFILITINISHADWQDALECGVKKVVNSFYAQGNTGNIRLSNLEQVYFELENCGGVGSSSFYGSFCVAHTELGIVKAEGCHLVPPSIYKSWLETLITAKLNSRKIGISGEGSGSTITKPITFIF